MKQLIQVLLWCAFIVQPLFADPSSQMGSGNIIENTTKADLMQKIAILKASGVSMLRLANSGYYDQYGTTGTSEKRLDSLVLWCHAANISLTFLFEYYPYPNFPYPINTKSQWQAIGAAFAGRFSPNSSWLTGQNIRDWGVTIYQAVNEPDLNQGIDKTKYHDALEGLADGVHAVDPSLKVLAGGFATPNAYSNYTCAGYAQAIADLLNNGKLDGIDLHTYASIWAPLEWYTHSAQHDFDAVKLACGITREINFYCSEFNYNKQAAEGVPGVQSIISQDQAANYFLTQIWDNLGITGNSGTVVSQLALAWTLFATVADDSGYGLCTSTSPFAPVTRATTYSLVANLTSGMQFTRADPRLSGEYELSGNNKKMWVWQNRSAWTNHFADSFVVRNIPSGATKLDVYGWDGLRTSFTLSGQAVYTVKNLAQGQTYMFVANALGDPVYAVAPGVPANLSASGSNRTIQLFWDPALNAATYVVKRSTASGGPYTTIASNLISTTCTDTGLTNGTPYHYVVASVNNKGTSANSAEASARPGILTPADLIVTAIMWTPAQLQAGTPVRLSCVVKNQGGTATPIGTVVGVAFSVNNAVVAWSDTSAQPLAPGASRMLVANGGSSSGLWTPATNGIDTIVAHVDDVSRITESDKTNNTLTKILQLPASLSGVILAAPTTGTIVPTGGSMTLLVNASDSSGIAKVQFFDKVTKLGETATAPYTFNWQNISKGRHLITAIALTNRGTADTSLPSIVIAADHTFKLQVTSGWNYISIFRVFNGVTWDTVSYKDSSIQYSSGFSFHSAGWAQSQDAGATALLPFNGTRLELLASKLSWGGSGKAYIDGLYQQDVSFNSATESFGVVFTWVAVPAKAASFKANQQQGSRFTAQRGSSSHQIRISVPAEVGIALKIAVYDARGRCVLARNISALQNASGMLIDMPSSGYYQICLESQSKRTRLAVMVR